MKKHNLLSIILLGIVIASCGTSQKDKLSYFSFNTSSFKEQYQPNESISLEIVNNEKKEVDSIIYYVNDVKVATKKGLEKVSFDLKDRKLGYQNLKALVYFEGENVETTARIELVSSIEPKLLSYKIVNVFPHDTLSFTEGLEFYRDTLFESVGQYNKSKLLKTNYKTGAIYKSVDLEGNYFGEGITILNNQIIQLTYKELTGFVYNADTWKVEKTFTFDKQVEGWGLTNDGTFLYQSDGTEKIWKMDPKTLKMIDYMNVYTNTSKIKSVNELEWINGKIYCNIWQKDAIAIVNPDNGAVEAILNLSDLRKQVKNSEAEVLNGIAYNPKTKTIFVTGKYWSKMFEIKVTE
ncbi:MAG: glutaminyl-peptide cyclotransferase [Bacteroidia bacterium]|nr:glutaminyl-peptide cyclotransferase [Bacteroidia bacterium]